MPDAVLMQPALTTIKQPFEEVGKAAAGLLLQMLSGETVSAERVLVEPKLMVRETTAPPAELGML